MIPKSGIRFSEKIMRKTEFSADFAVLKRCRMRHSVFERKPAPDLIRGGYRFA
jgi:hypothetical protein